MISVMNAMSDFTDHRTFEPGPTLTGVLPRGVVAFLLTDVEGSTQLWCAESTEMATAIARHYEILADAIEAFGGVRPEEQGEGDSVVGAFARPSDALAAAIAAQRALFAEPWPTSKPLRIRIALHVGEARLRNDANYVGETIIRCARIRSCGHGGQILTSQPFAEVVEGLMPVDTGFVSLGAHPLKDIERPETLFQLTHPELPCDFPAVRSTLSLRHNLPRSTTEFVGRIGQHAEVVALLRRHRLVTLVGTGGVGKTRLALELGRAVLDQYPGGVWFVDLAPVTQSESVGGVVLHAMGGREMAGRTVVEQLAKHVGDEPTLVLLDNCEHVLDASARWASESLAATSALSIVATSREALSVSGEATWRVPSLALPDAIELFTESARRVRSNLALDTTEQAAVEHICVRLDGVPLAIELAAARCRSLAPSRIAVSLDDRFRLLTGGARTALARQQTLLASVDWSYQLLELNEQLAFRRLSVFTGPFDLDAAEAVLSSSGDVDRYDVLDIIDRLVEKSLVVTDDGRRYRLLETLRQFAGDLLLRSPEAAAIRDAHCRYYREWVTPFANYPRAEEIGELSERYPNLITALLWAVETSPSESPLLVRGCAWIWYFERRYDDFEMIGLAQVLPVLEEHDRGLWVDAIADVSEAWLSAQPAVFLAQIPAMLKVADEIDRPRALARHNLWAGSAKADLSLLRVAVHHATRSKELGFLAIGATIQIALAHSRRGEVRQARETVDSISAAETSGGIHPLIFASAQLNSAFESGGLDGALVEAGAVSHRLWELGMRDPTMQSALAYVRWIGSMLSQASDNALVDFARSLASLSDLSRLMVPMIDRADELHAGSLVDAKPILAVFDTFAFGAHRRVEFVWLFLGSGLLDDALAALEPLRESHADWPSVQISAALLDGLRADDPDLFHTGLRLALDNDCRRSAVDHLEAIACSALRVGDEEQAARIAGACETERERMAGYRFRYRHLDALDALRESSAWTAGQALAFDDVVAYAQRMRGERRRPTIGWDSLTPTELRVVEAVVLGLSNPQVATQLFMSLATVKTHLSHVFTKLGIASRTDLTRLATSRRRAR